MANIYHIGIRWIKTPISDGKIKKIERALGAMGDWAHLTSNIWYTNHSANAVYEGLRTRFHADDSTVVRALDPSDISGWAPKWF